MSVILLVVTDGRGDCIAQTVPSALAHLRGDITYKLIFDDSGDMAYRDWLVATFPEFDVIHPMARQGFGGAIRSAWSHLSVRPERFVFHCEDDYRFNRPVDLGVMGRLLEDRPYLAQVALRRQAVGHEIPHGGFMEMYPDWYVDCADVERSWIETTRNFTTNPCLYRRHLCSTLWPEGSDSEGRYGFQLREQGLPWGIPGGDVRFGFWGSKADAPWVHHIGVVRVGTGY